MLLDTRKGAIDMRFIQRYEPIHTQDALGYLDRIHPFSQITLALCASARLIVVSGFHLPGWPRKVYIEATESKFITIGGNLGGMPPSENGIP